MEHLGEGTLRRLLDEPSTVSTRDRQHYNACARCRRAYDEIARDARWAAAQLAAPPAKYDPNLALTRLRRLLEVEGTHARASWPTRLVAALGQRQWPTRSIGALVAAAGLVVVLALTPAHSMAQRFLTIFQPTQLAPISISPGELRALPDLRMFGTVNTPRHPQTRTVASAAVAGRRAHMHVLQPRWLPSGLPAPQYGFVPAATSSFTFRAARARRYAQHTGRHVPPMPSNINGSTLLLHTGAAVLTVYGSGHGMPDAVLAEATVPTLTSTGASVRQIERYLLHLPGVSPQLAQQIEAIGNPATTLPIPVPVNLAVAQTVEVQGVKGLAIADNTGVAGGVVWQKNGIVYGVGGALTKSQLLRIANSLR